MAVFIFGVFLILHGLVHLLYTGQSWRLFELRPGLLWPDDSWSFVKVFGNDATRYLASFLLILAALGFIGGGLGLLLGQGWWRSITIGTCIFSTAIFILFWDGKFQALSEQGGIAILLNLAISILVLIFG